MPDTQQMIIGSTIDMESLIETNKQLNLEVRKLTRQLERERTLAKRNRDNYKAKYNFTEFITAERTRLERHMNLLLQNTRDYLLFFDSQGHVVFYTESFYRALVLDGREALNIKGKHFSDIFTNILPDNVIQEISEFYENSRNLKTQANYQVQCSIDFSHAGEMRDFLIEITQMRDTDGKLAGTMVFLMDTTDFVRARREAEAANAAKSDFLASMSHEIRTPMNAVIGLTNMLASTNLDEHQCDLLEKIESASTTLLSLINDILDFSKIEAGKLELIEEYYDLSQVLYNVQIMFDLMMQQKELRFECYFDPQLPRVVFGDAKRVRQVVTNLLSNAYKYTHSGSVTFKVQPAAGGQAQFSVSDTGIGIKEEDLGKLFNEFSQLELSKNKHVVGTGLGLAISKRLVEGMGGFISVESIYEQGSTFTFTIPLVQGTPADLQSGSAASTHNFIAPEARVLIVDDVEVNLEIAAFMLEAFEVTCEYARNGQEAIERLKQQPDFDLVLMDHMMPVLDGVEATRQIRKLSGPAAKVPIIALTANALAGNDQVFAEAGMNSFVSKPIAMAELTEALYQYLPIAKIVMI